MAESESIARPRRSFDVKTRVTTKVGVSLLFGLVAFSVAQLLDANAEASIMLGVGASVFVSGVAFVTQFLIDVDNRIDSVEDRVGALDQTLQLVNRRHDANHEELKRTIRDEFRKISTATDLFVAVDESGLQADAIQLIQSATTVMKQRPPLVFDFAQAEINRLASYLKALGQGGDVTYEGEDRDWLLGLTRVAQLTVDATSLSTVDAGGRPFVDGGLWNSDLGEQYLTAQRDAVSRGVKVRRLFIMDTPERQDDEHFNKILKQQVDNGVTVRTLRRDDLDVTRRLMLTDFIVIDGVLSYQATAASHAAKGSPTIANTTLVTNPDRVRERIERFKTLWEVARPFPADGF